jgi:uncharacterized protein YjbI with pentapeptide repeats
MKREELTLLIWKERKEDKNKRITISYEWFLGEDLNGLDLSNILFDGCVFLESNLRNCNFDNTIFSKCILSKCDFGNAPLNMSMFSRCAHDIGQSLERSNQLIKTLTLAFYDSAIQAERNKIQQERAAIAESQKDDINEEPIFKMDM